MATDWIKKWEEGDIRFHQGEFHSQLVKFGGKFSTGTILVPLCGKTLDMIYLASPGHQVVGVELSHLACLSFFQENNIPFTEKQSGDFVLFESDKITLWCGDFFKLPQSVWDQVSGVYDRAALVALPEELRRKYAAEISGRSQKKLEILLIAYEYPEGTVQGPPFSVPESEIKNLYGEFSQEMIHSATEEKVLKDHPKFKSVKVIEATYWLKRG